MLQTSSAIDNPKEQARADALLRDLALGFVGLPADRIDHAKIWEAVEVLPQVDRFSNYIINGEIGVETTMTRKLNLLVYIQDSYHSEPAAGRLKNDIKLVSAVKYKF